MANVAKVIASNPEIACTNYGLSDLGKEQARAAGETVVNCYQQQHNDDSETNKYIGVLILASDLLRAKETAQAVAAAVTKALIPLYKDGIVLETRLRERGFGQWDGGSDKHYQDVWNDDALDPTHQIKNVESVMAVTDRATRCIVEWDSQIEDYLVVCVAHGDVLQILQTAYHKMDGSKHRTMDHLETATLRPLVLLPPQS
jgi:glucosyl-3-phosphoglycerate phosphatase